MKLVLAGLWITAIAIAQSKPVVSQTAKDCSQNFSGNNNTGTITCYGVDKDLAARIRELVEVSKRDGKTLEWTPKLRQPVNP